MGQLGGTVTSILTAQSEPPRKKRLMLPLLTILFVVSYVLLTLVVVEQGRTIQMQRGLVRELLQDSTQLAALKVKLAREEAERAQQATQPKQKPPAPNPPAKGKTAKRPAKSPHSMRSVPAKPAADLEDVRRSTQVI